MYKGGAGGWWGGGGWGGVEGVGGGLNPPGDTSGLAVGQRSTHISPRADLKAKETSTFSSIPSLPY